VERLRSVTEYSLEFQEAFYQNLHALRRRQFSAVSLVADGKLKALADKLVGAPIHANLPDISESVAQIVRREIFLLLKDRRSVPKSEAE